MTLRELVGESCMVFGKNFHARDDLKCQRPSFVPLKIRKSNNSREEESQRNEMPENFAIYFAQAPSILRAKKPGKRNLNQL